MRNLLALWVTVCITTTAFGYLPSDNFDDNTIAPFWREIEDVPGQLSVTEQNNRLDILASGSTNPTNDALYISDGDDAKFWLATSDDFEITIEYFFSAAPAFFQDGALGLVFGVGRDLDGTDSAAIGYGAFRATVPNPLFPTFPVDPFITLSGSIGGTGSRTDDFEDLAEYPATPAANGNMFIRYDATNDLLFGRFDGLTEVQFPDQPVADWGAEQLFVSFGARGNGTNRNVGDAWLDNFEVLSGTVIVPEPTSLALLSLAGLAVLRRRRENA